MNRKPKHATPDIPATAEHVRRAKEVAAYAIARARPLLHRTIHFLARAAERLGAIVIRSKHYLAQTLQHDFFTAPRLSLQEQVFFIKRLAFLNHAGFPMLESLWLLREQGRSRGFLRVINSVIHDIESGRSLSKSLSVFPYCFSDFAVHIVEVGEMNGILSQNLTYLAEELRKKQALRRKVLGALFYPAIIMIATIGITTFLLAYLFPKIMPIFASLNTRLPLSTRILMHISTFAHEWGIATLVACALVIIAAAFCIRKNEKCRTLYHTQLLRLPVLGSTIRSYHLAQVTRTLGLLLKSGAMFSGAIATVAKTTHHPLYRASLSRITDAVYRGESPARSLESEPLLYPDVVRGMVFIGERTGNLSNTFLYLSELYEQETDDITKILSSLVEPALLVGMGLLVGFVAISIIAPIYGLTQNLHA